MEQRNDLLDVWDRDHFIHPLTPLGGHERGESPTRIVSSGSGVYIVDRNGRKLLDAFAGLFCVNVGYGRTEIAEAMAEQALVEDDDVIETLTADRANDALDVGILPR